jgi:hypothetical protein
VRVGAPDASLTANAGLAAVAELCGRLGVIEALDAAVGPIKQRDCGFGAGELLGGIAAAQLAGEDFLTGLDRQRADAAGQQITPVPGLAPTTAQWRAVESGLAAVTGRMLGMLPAPRVTALTDAPVTIDLDTTDVEVYGRKSAAWPGTTRASGWAVRMSRPGPRPRPCWPPTWATAPMTRARPRRTCCAAPWPACRNGHGTRGGWRCALMRGTSPGRRPAPPTTRRSCSRSAPRGSRRCGGCWPASPRTPGTTPSRWTERRWLWRSTARTWMWGALLAASMAAWLHQLTAITAREDIVHGHGVRGGKAMIPTLRWRLIAVPGRLTHHARHLVLRLPPGHGLLPEVPARLPDLTAPA